MTHNLLAANKAKHVSKIEQLDASAATNFIHAADIARYSTCVLIDFKLDEIVVITPSPPDPRPASKAQCVPSEIADDKHSRNCWS